MRVGICHMLDMLRERIQHRSADLRLEIIWRLAWLVATAIAVTLRITVRGEERIKEYQGRGLILLTWHGTTVIPMYYFRHRGFYAISSTSRDGELQSKLLASRGFKLVRGSSARGAVKALLESARRLREGAVLTLTPDGPRGPNRRVQSGSVLLADRTGAPIIPVGVACRYGKRVASWDRHLIPCPFSRAAIFVGDPIVVDLKEKTVDEWCEVIRRALNAADESAAAMIGGRAA